jgi:hypothetical protein
VLGSYYLYCGGGVPLLFTHNETNNERLCPNHPSASGYLKDGIKNYVVHGRQEAVNPERHGTKVAAHYRLAIGPGRSATVSLGLSNQLAVDRGAELEGDPFPFGQGFDATMRMRPR